MQTAYAYYILHKLRRFPHEWLSLPRAEQAAIFALIDEKVKEDRRESARMRRAAKRR